MNCTKILITAFGFFVAAGAYAQGEQEIRAVDLNAADSSLAASVYDTNANRKSSEFDNHSIEYVRPAGSAPADYEDTEFGELLYNEASIPTRLEILRLLSKQTPPAMVFLQAVSMGLGIDDVLDAAVRYEPNRGRVYSQAAISLLPIISESDAYLYSEYQLDDIERDDDSKPYSVDYVAERFFEDREVLTPYPDWVEGVYHFDASVVELKDISSRAPDLKWYRTRSTKPSKERPIFVSLYERDRLVLVDGHDRIEQVLKTKGPSATMPVVFVYNRTNELAFDQLEYPSTLRGVQKAYSENNLMVTPAPEWQSGEYHVDATMEELYSLFEIPVEEDFEPEVWQALITEAEDYRVADTSFLAVMLASGDDEDVVKAIRPKAFIDGEQWAELKSPRSESAFPHPDSGKRVPLKSILGKGIIMSRPDLIAALNTLGVEKVPTAIYYVNSARIKPYRLGAGGLQSIVDGAILPPGNPGGHGGFGPPPECASPPCNN